MRARQDDHLRPRRSPTSAATRAALVRRGHGAAVAAAPLLRQHRRDDVEAQHRHGRRHLRAAVRAPGQARRRRALLSSRRAADGRRRARRGDRDRRSSRRCRRGVAPQDYLLDGGLWPSDPSEILSWLDPDVDPAVYESWYLGRARVSTTTLRRGHADGRLRARRLRAADRLRAARGAAISSTRCRAGPRRSSTCGPCRPRRCSCGSRAPRRSSATSDAGQVLGGYVEPFDTWADMQQLVDQERVPGSRTVAYFCNAAPTSAPPARGPGGCRLARRAGRARAPPRDPLPARGHRARSGATPSIRSPTTSTGGCSSRPTTCRGERRLLAQYWRANVEPSERYTLSVPGSSQHRIKPEATGLANLFAAGDWTSCHARLRAAWRPPVDLGPAGRERDPHGHAAPRIGCRPSSGGGHEARRADET